MATTRDLIITEFEDIIIPTHA